MLKHWENQRSSKGSDLLASRLDLVCSAVWTLYGNFNHSEVLYF